MSIRFTASAFRKVLSVYVFSYFPFGFESRMWDLIVSVPDHCLTFYFVGPVKLAEQQTNRLLFEPCHETTCLCHMRTTKAQISLRIGVA